MHPEMNTKRSNSKQVQGKSNLGSQSFNYELVFLLRWVQYDELRPNPIYCPLFFLENIFPISLLITRYFEDMYTNGEEKSIPPASNWQSASHWNFTRRNTEHVLFPLFLIKCAVAIAIPAVKILFALWIKT